MEKTPPPWLEPRRDAWTVTELIIAKTYLEQLKWWGYTGLREAIGPSSQFILFDDHDILVFDGDKDA